MSHQKHDCKKEKKLRPEVICGEWSTLTPMQFARENFASASGPDASATGTASGINTDPRVYVCGGNDINGQALAHCEKYNPNIDAWVDIAPLPQPLGNCAATFAPDYGIASAQTLGYIYVVGDNVPKIFQYNIKQGEWQTFDLPFAVTNASLQYLDDVGGPLAQLFVLVTGVDLPACTDGQTLWVVGGDGTEQQTWFAQSNIFGEIASEWSRGPDLPLFRREPIPGRVFWRDAGITSFGVSNCASIAVCGGFDELGEATRDVQLLVRNQQCNWQWITTDNNPTEIPDDVLTMAVPSAQGAFGTEQWPETLITGGRAIVFGGQPPASDNDGEGTTQFAQFRFTGGRYQRDKCLSSKGQPLDSAWNITTNMPRQRVDFRANPLAQTNSSLFGGRRVSRFAVIGGRDVTTGQVTNRNQLFQLPTPPTFLSVVRNLDRCRANDNGKKHNKHPCGKNKHCCR